MEASTSVGRDIGAMRIGEVAEHAGVNVQTLRYYERRGLLAEPERTAAGYRLYPGEVIQVVRFIKRAQELGFSLDEIDRLLELRNDRVSSCDDVRGLALEKIAAVDEKVRRLSALKDALDHLVQHCDEDSANRECPILEAMEEDGDARH